MREVSLGVVGCGYVADFYAQCLRVNAPSIRLSAAFDTAATRAESFADRYGGRACGSLDELLAQPGLDIVLNLTPPAAHADITEAALRAGRHVYSEKPLAADLARGRDLIRLARRRRLALGAAPAVHRSPAARRMRRLARAGVLGPLSHLYCDLDDGPLHRMGPDEWRSARDVPWPMDDEFRTGSVIHHLPYAVAWSTLFAGPVTSVRGHTAVTVADKCGVPSGPDLCLAVLEHESGCLTRLTVGALARRQRELVVVGEYGELRLPDMWSVDGPVLHDGVPVLQPGPGWPFDSTHRLNFDQGVRDLAWCLGRYGARGADLFTATYGQLALHTLEIVAAVSQPGPYDVRITTGLRATGLGDSGLGDSGCDGG